jgi:peroxiredoxin
MSRFSVLLLLLAVSAPICGQESQPPSTTAPTKPAISLYVETARPVSQIKADFPYDISLKTADGDTILSSEALAKNGKPTVLMFWLTTCMPCRLELKAISEKIESWRKEAGFNLYAISIDFPKNYEQFVKRVQESGWTFPAYYDLNREFRLVMPGELNGLPQTFVLDKNGKIVYHKRKYVPGDEDALFELIKTL